MNTKSIEINTPAGSVMYFPIGSKLSKLNKRSVNQ